MFSKKAVLFLLVAFFILYAFPPEFCALNRSGRKTLLANAIELCPEDLRAFLEKHEHVVRQGMYFVDRHSIKPGVNDIEGAYTCLVERMGDGHDRDQYNTVIKFGVLASFISEVVAPGRVICSSDNTAVKYDGFNEVENIHDRVSVLVAKSRPYCRSGSMEAKSNLWNIAVNEIVDFWVSAWNDSGSNVTKLSSVGTEIKNIPPDLHGAGGGVRSDFGKVQLVGFKLGHHMSSGLQSLYVSFRVINRGAPGYILGVVCGYDADGKELGRRPFATPKLQTDQSWDYSKGDVSPGHAAYATICQLLHSLGPGVMLPTSRL